MNMSIFNGIIYTLNSGILFALVLSYWLMYKIENKKHILAILLFILSVLIFNIIGNVHTWSNFMTGGAYRVPFPWLRGLLMTFSSIFLLHTTWRMNIKK